MLPAVWHVSFGAHFQKIDSIYSARNSPVNANKRWEQGITTTESLLMAAADRQGRHQLAGETGLAEELLLNWTNKADLMRVRGVGEEYSDLLEATGVDTVKELRRRNPQNLRASMMDVNENKHLLGPAGAFKPNVTVTSSRLLIISSNY